MDEILLFNICAYCSFVLLIAGRYTRLMKQFLIIISIFFTSCTGAFNDRQKVDKNLVSYVEIRKQFDTVALRLTNDQTSDFIDSWNNSSAKGPHKFLPEYFLTIQFKRDSALSYRTNGGLIKQKSDWAYAVGDKDYFKNIWFKQAGLTGDYFEYFPTYNNNGDGKFATDLNPLTEKQRNAIKQVLTYYDYKWKDIRGQIFYKSKIKEELLWNYTTKANDSTWLSTHK